MSAGTVTLDTCGNILLARMRGEIDVSNAEQLGAEVAEATPPDAQGVVLDLAEVEHLDSYGIFVIHGLRQRLAERRQALVLIVPKDARVHRTIELVRVADVIPTKGSLGDALRALGHSDS